MRQLFEARVKRQSACRQLLATVWLLFPPAAIVAACLSVAERDFRMGRQLARAIPSKAGGTICAVFTCAWGAWKFGAAGFALKFVSIFVFASTSRGSRPPDH